MRIYRFAKRWMVEKEASVGEIEGQLGRFIEKATIFRFATGEDYYVLFVGSEPANCLNEFF